MITLKGRSAYGGIAVGKLSLLGREEIKVKRIHTADSDKEWERYVSARDKTVSQLSELYQKALAEVGETNAQIFEIHAMMAQDEDYNESIENILRSQSVNAEYAVAVTSDNFAQMFSSMQDEYMNGRAADVRSVSNKILENLGGLESASRVSTISEKSIIAADDLTPGETVALDKDKVLAFATAGGSVNSHTAILARSMNIPALIGLGEDILREEYNGKTAAVDGFEGVIYIDPNDETLTRLEKRLDEERHKHELLSELKGKEDVTLDGKHIRLYANIGGISDIGAVLLNDAEGIGLFRSELLYLESDDFPDEETQFRCYKRVLESMAGKKVIIRTLDIGADKQIDYFGLEKETNPALGCRAIRICLKRPDIFKTQLRALYRASVYGDLGIMFPMIISVSEVEAVKRTAEQVREELKAENIPVNDATELGIMIETPAAAVISDKLAPLVDFFSMGTNDLSQYTLAIDRQNPQLDDFFDPHHEAIMRLIEFTCESARKNGIWVGICGELAADTSLTERFLRMGITELSVSPPAVLPLRKRIREIDLSIGNGG